MERETITWAARPAALRSAFAPLASLGQRIRRAPRRHLLGTVAGLAAYLLAMRLGGGGNRPEQFAGCGFVLALEVWSDATRRFSAGMLPFWIFGFAYDLTHVTQPLFRYLTIHVAQPYHFDLTFFGISTAGGVLTPNEFFAIHHWPAVDLIAGTAYIVFFVWPLAFAAGLALFRRDPQGQRLLRRFGWTFLFMNLVGFATYYVYPAAPPWYVTQYGFGPAHLEAHPSVAAAARWDQMTGIPFFAGLYSRSADVFGAIPSLHVTYPLLTFLHGLELRRRWLDAASMGLFLAVAFGAVYLNHHYVLDVLLGVLYALVAWGIDRALERRRQAAGLAA